MNRRSLGGPASVQAATISLTAANATSVHQHQPVLAGEGFAYGKISLDLEADRAAEDTNGDSGLHAPAIYGS
jgi:hypothetical protein